MENKNWFHVSNLADIPSPALLIYPDRVRDNIRRMIAIAGGADRLCPHVKTHKLPQLTQMQREMGITKFKCATIAEAEMVASVGAPHVLFAYQPVGPNLARFVDLIRQCPQTRFATIADDEATLRNISAAAIAAKISIPVMLDIECGMGRTGISAGPAATKLYSILAAMPGIIPEGLHVFDGHIADSDHLAREQKCEAAFSPVAQLREELLKATLPCPRLVAGGTASFPIHARRMNIECSPGTTVLWDEGYGSRFRDLEFLHAALVLTRVISKPSANRLCLDLGHKAVAAEIPHPRVKLLEFPEAKPIMHSEEHLVVETDRAADITVGSALYGVPWHICPTVALHAEAVVIEKGVASAKWPIAARARRLGI